MQHRQLSPMHRQRYVHREQLILLYQQSQQDLHAGLTYTYFTDAAGTITLATPNAVGAGTYYIVGTTAAGCASAPTPVTVTVNAAPTVVTNAPAAVCAPGTVDLTVTSSYCRNLQQALLILISLMLQERSHLQHRTQWAPEHIISLEQQLRVVHQHQHR